MNKRLFIVIIICSISITGCFIVKKITGADIDEEQFDKAREAKVTLVKANNLEALSKKLDNKSELLDFDVFISINEILLNKILHQYDSTSGWFDSDTRYFIDKMILKVENGSSIVSIIMIAHSNKYNVDVNLITDCLLSFEISGTELLLHLEPFNISPYVEVKGLLSSADELIKNLIKVNLANLEKNLPQMKVPLSFNNVIAIPKNSIEIKDKINMRIDIPTQNINYKLKIKDILCIDENVLITMKIERVEVK